MYKICDWKKNFEDNIRIQRKFLEGFETMMHLNDTKPGFSEKTEVYAEDKMRLYHYKPLKKDIVSVLFRMISESKRLHVWTNNAAGLACNPTSNFI